MKTILFFTLTLLTFVTLAFVPNSFAQDDSPEYVVRVIYFLPNDRQPDPDIDTKLDKLIKGVQQFYADQMEVHGFKRKTFRFEADDAGKCRRASCQRKIQRRLLSESINSIVDSMGGN